MKLEPKALQALLNNLVGYEIRFCEEYMEDFNARKAVARANIAGHTKPGRTKKLVASLLGSKHVQRYIRHLHGVQNMEYGISPKKIIREMSYIAFQDIRQYMTTDENGNIRLRKLEDMPNTAAIKKLKNNQYKGRFRGRRFRENDRNRNE